MNFKTQKTFGANSLGGQIEPDLLDGVLELGQGFVHAVVVEVFRRVVSKAAHNNRTSAVNQGGQMGSAQGDITGETRPCDGFQPTYYMRNCEMAGCLRLCDSRMSKKGV